jgi:lambda family phage tail tape measure protein
VAYRADIEIAVKGAQELKRLQNEIRRSADAVNSLNSNLSGIANLVPRSFNNINKVLSEAAVNFNKVALGTEDASTAAQNYYQANKNLNNALRERVKLLDDIQRAERGAVLSNIKASRAAREASGFGAFSSSIDTPTQKSIRRNREKTGLATAAAETAAAVQKLTERQEEFTTRTDAAAQASARQTAAFLRQKRVALEVAKINAAAPVAQLLLAPAAAGAPAMSGGARRRITGPVERLGGARTDDEAAATLRLAQATNTLTQATNKIDPKYNRFLPSSELLNATGRGLQQLTTNQTAFNNTVASGIRFQEKYNQELERQQRLGIGIPSNRRPGTTNAVFGGQFPVDGPVSLQSPGRRAVGGIGKRLPGAIGASVIGGAFPLLFGQGGAAATGGAIGGLFGGLAGSALGPAGGFAGSLVGTVLGDIADKGNKIKELAKDMGLAADETAQLSAAFKAAGADADKFADSVQAIRGVGFSDPEQVEAIKLVSKLTEDYSGKIDKTTAAYANFAAKGKVGIADLYKFTAQGIPILDTLEKKFGTNRDGVLQLAQDGKISAQQLSDALVSIANGATTAAEKTKTPFQIAWGQITEATADAVAAIGMSVNTILEPVVYVTGEIAKLFGNAFAFIVKDGIETAAELSGIIADIANDLLYLTKLDIFKGIKEGARERQKALQDLNKPPTKTTPVKGITIPGQAPDTGKPPEDRSKQIFQDILRLRNQIREAYLDQAKAAIQATEFSEGEAAAVALQLNKFEEISKVRTDILDTERTLAMASVESGEQASLINQLYKSKLQLLKDQNALEQKQLQRKAAELALEKQLAAISREQAIEDIARPIQQQQDSTRLGIAAFTQSTQVTEQQNLALEQRNRLEEGQLPFIRERMRLEEEIASGDFTGTALETKQLDLDASTRRLGVLREELGLLDQLEQRQLRLQQFFATYGQLIQSVSGEIANAVTFGVAEMVKGTKTAKEVFADFLNAIGSALISAAQQMIATYIAIGIAKIFAGMGGGGGNAASALGSNPNVAAYSPLAKGGTFANGIATFAKGGTFSNSIVSSPTLFKFADGGTTRTGLMGEAGPEAIMPLKRGSDGSLGVQATGLREAMGRPPGGANGSPVLNMSFQSTTINGIEYVSRDQLEAAMAATRRQAAKEGANRGMNMTLDKIQNSPSTRSRVGIR